MSVFVWIELHNGQPIPASFEALGLARQLGDRVTGLVFGQGVDDAVKAAFAYGADTVIKADDASLARYRFEPYVALLAGLVKEHSPAIVLAAATTSGRELLAGAAADVEAACWPMSPNCRSTAASSGRAPGAGRQSAQRRGGHR